MPVFAFAQQPQQKQNLKGITETAAEKAGYDKAYGDDTGLARIVGSIIRMFLSIIGILFLIYTIYGGFTWMMAAGNEDQVKKAKDIIRSGVIGLIVTLGSLSIYLLINQFLIGSQTPPAI